MTPAAGNRQQQQRDGANSVANDPIIHWPTQRASQTVERLPASTAGRLLRKTGLLDCRTALDCGLWKMMEKLLVSRPGLRQAKILSGLFKRSLARLPLYCRLTVLWRDPKIETLISQMTGNLWPTKRQKLICQLRLLQRCPWEENTEKRFDTLSTEKEPRLLFQLRQWQTGER